MSASDPSLVATEASAPNDLARARRAARIPLAILALAFIALNVVTLFAIAHNNRLEHYPLVTDATATYAALVGGVFILAACWFATTRLRPPMVHLAWVLPAAGAVVVAFGQLNAIASMRPLVNSASYDTAIKEFGDTFVNAAKLTDAQVEASRLISRVASEDTPSAQDLRAAMDACDALIARLTTDATFLETWPQVCRDILRKHGVSERRIEHYARGMERTNDTSTLLESNAQLAMLLSARKVELRGRLARLEQDATTAAGRDGAESFEGDADR